MENGTKVNKTEIKYEVTSCYFCNEFLDKNDFKSHLEKCGQALQKCPKDCRAFIQRKFMEEHLLDCPKNMDENSTISPKNKDFQQELDTNMLHSALNEETRQRLRLIADIRDLRHSFKSEIEKRNAEFEVFKMELKNLSQQYQNVKEWRAELRVLLDKFQENIEFRNEVTLNFEVLLNRREEVYCKIKTLETQVSELVDQDKSITSTSNSTAQLESSCNRCRFLEWKLCETQVELRQMQNTVFESEVKCDRSNKMVNEMQKVCAQTKQDLADLQNHLKVERKMKTITNCDGHLIWCIDHFAEKLKDAKENDVKLKSPLFCNKQYGYTLRLDVLLNGSGSWKHRNTLACLTIVTGEWDSLLEWPCTLKADIILRNQLNDQVIKSLSQIPH